MKIETFTELSLLPIGTDLFIVPQMQFIANPFNYYLSISANVTKLHPAQKVRNVTTELDYPEFINVYESDLKRAQYTEPDDVAEHFQELNYGEESTVGDPVVMFTDESEAIIYFYVEFQKTLESFNRLGDTLKRISKDIDTSPFILEHKDKYPEKWI